MRAVQEPTASPRNKTNSFYNVACCYGLLQEATQASHYLAQAIDAGYVDARHIAADPDLNLLHQMPQWPALMARARRREAKTIIHNPNRVQLVTTDIDHFWTAYTAARQDTAHAQAYFRTLYFNQGSRGLQDYYRPKIRQDATFTRVVLRRPRYYQSIQATTLAIAR